MQSLSTSFTRMAVLSSTLWAWVTGPLSAFSTMQFYADKVSSTCRGDVTPYRAAAQCRGRNKKSEYDKEMAVAMRSLLLLQLSASCLLLATFEEEHRG
ncbi:hypothetical protein EB796_015842 [Bugula neritina]|uniref:Secreted protein n=1 Tax=Bugula neritina TaxID=10212 RepID=A0A7J7JIA5_BUGNE|nr:hypothetical protein EB796_015842 [Bugula neritina]